MEPIKEIENATLSKYFSMDKAIALYPKIKDQIMPLSISGISARSFFQWKKAGIIDYPDNVNVKLNLFQYVWLRICSTLRSYGIPFEVIKNIKESMFSDIGDQIIARKEEFLEKINKDEEHIEFFKAFIPLLEKEYKNFAQENRIFTSAIGTAITTILLLNKESTIIISQDNSEIVFEVIVYGTVKRYIEHISKYCSKSYLSIPIRSIVSDFFVNNNNDKYIEKFELLTKEEKLVLDAMKRKDFKEILIKRNNESDDLKISLTKDGDIIGDKVNEIKRILCLNEYSDITLKTRNNKHIYFENKIRLDK
jgi:hypothetical protein